MREMSKKLKRFLAMFLAIAMVMSNSNYAFAADFAAENQTEDAQESAPEAEPAAVDAAVDAGTEEPVTEPQTTEPAAQDEEKEPELTEPETEDPSAEPVQEEPAAEEVTYPAFETQKVLEDETVIKITAEEGVLPEGTTAEINELDYEEDLQDVLDTALSENKAASVDAKMADVVLKDKDGNVIQPNGKVEITISNLNLDIPEEYKDLVSYNAYRINDDETLTVLKENVEITENEVKFENDHFTAVGIVAEAAFLEEAEEAEVLAAGLTTPSTKLYDGYKDDSLESVYTKKSFIHPLYIADDDGENVAYCFNAAYAWPTPQGTATDKANGYKYRKVENANALDMNKYSRIDDVNMRANVLRVVYNGYPYNKAGIKNYYNLTAMQYRAVTQAAIWWVTDRESLQKAAQTLCYKWIGTATNGYYQGPYFDWTTNMTNAYNALIGTTYTVTPPEEFQLDIFVTEGNLNPSLYPNVTNIQNLLSTKMGEIADEETSISVTKKWDGVDANSDNCPDSVVVNLYANGKFYSDHEITKKDGWKYTFANLPLKVNGKTIEYTIGENAVEGFTTAITGSASKGFVVTNTKEEKPVTPPLAVNITAKKTLDGAEPGARSFTFGLWKGTDTSGAPLQTAVNDAQGNVTFEAIENANDGDVYTIKEILGNDADITYDTSEKQVTIKSTVVGTEYIENAIEVVGYQANDGSLHVTVDGVDLTCYCIWQNKPGHDGDFTPTINPNDEQLKPNTQAGQTGGTTFNVIGVGKKSIAEVLRKVLYYFNQHEGEKVNGGVNYDGSYDQFTIDENTKQSMIWRITGGTTGTTSMLQAIANIYKATPSVPDDFKVIMFASNNDKQPVITAFMPTTSLVSNYVGETNVPTFNNTTKVSVNVNKVWNDNNDQDKLRPNAVTVTLYADGKATNQKVTLTQANGWAQSFTNLRKYNDNGNEIVYTVKENAVSGYTEETTGSAAEGFTITNTHTPEEIKVEGTKTWVDNNDELGNRPESITVNLKVDNQTIRTQVVKPDQNGNWKYSFDKLPKYKDGAVIKYSVEEAVVPTGYQSTVVGTDIINTYTPDNVAVHVEKVWDDDENRDGHRPNSVVVHLYSNDGSGAKDTGMKATLSLETGWKASFSDLPKIQGGRPIEYTVQEESVPGYETPVITTQEGEPKHITITNTHKPEVISIQGTKSWNDNNNQDGVRPESVEVILKANGTEVQRTVAAAANGWTYKFENLQEYQNGKKIDYTVQEGAVPEGYQSAVSGYNITNTYNPEKVAVQVTKAWVDNNDQDGLRANSVTIHLLADGVDTNQTVILSEANKWLATFSDLDKYQDGKEIIYTVSEDAVKGYSTTITTGDDPKHFTVTNTHAAKTVEVAGTKTWNDNADQDGKRPGYIRVQLLADGVAGEVKTVTEKDNWSWTFTNLPENKDGKKINYTVQELNVPEGYQSSVNGYNITNSYTPGKVAIQVEKAWNDNNNQDGKRPNSVTVHLYADGKDTGKSMLLNEGTNWTAEFKDLDEFNDGKKIKYTVSEDKVNLYTTEITQTDADGKHFKITNTHTPEVTSVTGTKSWNDNNDQDGRRPEYVEVILKKAGQEVARKTVTEADGWKYTFDNLPKYENNGSEIRYTVQEGKVAEGYQSSVNGYDITNSYTPGRVSIQVAKSWIDNDNQDGIRPNSVTVHLYANGIDTNKTVDLNAGNKWIANFEDLDEYVNGEKVVYTVVEDKVTGYDVTVTTGSDEKHFTITNTHTPELTSISGTKTWNDNKDQDGKRPESVEIILKRAGQEVARKTVTEADGWKYTFTNLPKYENNGSEIRYSVQEAAIPEGYQSSVNGYNITNNYTPTKIAVQVAKSWEDNDNQDGIRPQSVTVHLLENGVDKGKKVELNAGNNWIANFEDLPKNSFFGNEIVYTVVEDAVEGYKTTVTTGADPHHFTITNTHTPEVTSISGTKSWNDNNDQDGKRPDSVEVLLKKGGQVIDRKTVTEANGWNYTFNNLPKYENNGSLIRYSVQEGKVAEGYSSTVDSNYNITNSYTPGKVNIQVAKSWIDNNNQDGIRPQNVIVRLYADNKDTGNTVVLDAGNNWIGNFADLDEYNDGNKVVYTVKEDAVKGYTATITTGADEKHFTITNTHTPEVISVAGTKSWNDSNNQDGKRPKSVEIILKKAGQEIARKTVTADDNWKYEFSNLPKYENNGSEIRYTVQEGKVAEGYQSSVKGYDITNTYTPGKVSIQAAKSWEDNNNQDGIRPEKVTVRLYVNNKGTGKVAELSEKNGWIANFEGLDEYTNGVKNVYTIKEDAVEGYKATITQGADEKHFTITNTHTPEVVKVEGTKTWDDSNDNDGKRPVNVEILLKKGGQIIDRKKVTERDNWTYSFTNLPKYEGGKEIRYSVEEANVPEGYQSSIKGYDIKNSYTPGEIAIQVAKSWQDERNLDGVRPSEVKVWLYKDGQKTDQFVVLNEKNNWTANFSNLPEMATRQKIVYTVQEESVKEYTATYETSQEGRHTTITNTHTPERVSVSVEKQWDDKENAYGLRPTNVKVILYQEDKGELYYVTAAYVSEAEGWKYTFDNLPKYVYDFKTKSFVYDENGNKEEVKYVVKEDTGSVEKYVADPEVIQNGEKDFTIINKLDNKEVEISKTDVGGKELPGAKLTVTSENGTVVDSWTSEADKTHKVTVPAGKYTMTEVTAPDGYEKAESITFTVDSEGKVSVDNKEVDKVTMVDNYKDQTVVISKTNITGSEELVGAELVVKDLTGKTIEEWTSEADGGHKVTLQPGTYVLSETSAPQGYKVTESITFNVDHLGKTTIVKQTEKDGVVSYEEVETVDKVVMKDDYENGKVIISKTDVAGSEIEGAKLEITDKDGKVVEQWTSEKGKNKEVELYPGTYTLTEKTAPKGYEIAESITFTVDQNSKVTVEGEEVGKVTMVDEYSEHTVKFSKTDIKGKELKGASIELKDENGNVIEKWKSDGKVKEFKLKPGKYTFTETAAPEGYEIASSITFEVGIDGSVTSKDVTVKGSDKNLIVMVDDYAKKPASTPKKTTSNSGSSPIRTGDAANTTIWLLMIAVSLTTVIAIIRRRFLHK